MGRLLSIVVLARVKREIRHKHTNRTQTFSQPEQFSSRISLSSPTKKQQESHNFRFGGTKTPYFEDATPKGMLTPLINS